MPALQGHYNSVSSRNFMPFVTELNKNDEIFSAKKPAAPPAPPAPTRAPDARRPGAGVESATPAPTLSCTGLPRGPPLTRGSHYLDASIEHDLAVIFYEYAPRGARSAQRFFMREAEKSIATDRGVAVSTFSQAVNRRRGGRCDPSPKATCKM